MESCLTRLGFGMCIVRRLQRSLVCSTSCHWEGSEALIEGNDFCDCSGNARGRLDLTTGS